MINRSDVIKMKQQPTVQLFGKPKETYYFLGLTGVLMSVVFLAFLSLDGKYYLIDLVINFLTAITIVYAFNVVRAFCCRPSGVYLLSLLFVDFNWYNLHQLEHK